MTNKNSKLIMLLLISGVCLLGITALSYAEMPEHLRLEKTQAMPVYKEWHPITMMQGPLLEEAIYLPQSEGALQQQEKTQSENTKQPLVPTAPKELAANPELPTAGLKRIFDKEGNLIGFSSINITRDANGRITEIIEKRYNANGKLLHTTVKEHSYKLDSKGRVTETTVTCKRDGKLLYTAEHKYTRDAKGQVVLREATFRDSKGNVMRTAVETFKRDKSGKITESTIVRKDGKGNLLEIQTNIRTYDKEGRLKQIAMTVTDASGKKTLERENNYQSGVLKNTVTKHYKEGELSRKVITNYY